MSKAKKRELMRLTPMEADAVRTLRRHVQATRHDDARDWSAVGVVLVSMKGDMKEVGEEMHEQSAMAVGVGTPDGTPEAMNTLLLHGMSVTMRKWADRHDAERPAEEAGIVKTGIVAAEPEELDEMMAAFREGRH